MLAITGAPPSRHQWEEPREAHVTPEGLGKGSTQGSRTWTRPSVSSLRLRGPHTLKMPSSSLPGAGDGGDAPRRAPGAPRLKLGCCTSASAPGEGAPFCSCFLPCSHHTPTWCVQGDSTHSHVSWAPAADTHLNSQEQCHYKEDLSFEENARWGGAELGLGHTCSARRLRT